MKLSLAVALTTLLPSLAGAHPYDPTSVAPGSLVNVSVEVDGRQAALYPAPDGSGRFYLEARPGSLYAVRLDNRTQERLGVLLTVDGLNAISGERQLSGPGRMYILDPWDGATIQGWRTSMDEVRRFTFVDEKASYAARSGKANGKMGWIEVAVYRERRPVVWRQPRIERDGRDSGAAPSAEAPAAKSKDDSAPNDGDVAQAPRSRAQSYPGTGWGERTDDRAVVVDFEAQSYPAQTMTLRYEYRSALHALGILPRPCCGRDRLQERESGVNGFAQPPTW